MFESLKSKFTDDGVNFQWGDQYIKSEEIIPGVGGKYWKYNSKGKVVSFTTPEHVFKSFVSWLINNPYGTPIKSLKDIKIDDKLNSIRFKSVESFSFAINEAQNDHWIGANKPNLSIKRVDDGSLTIYLDIENKVYSGINEFID